MIDGHASKPDTLATSGASVALPAASGPVVFAIGFRVRPGREDAFLALLAPVLDAMRHEPTFIDAVLHRDPEDPTQFMLYETWADLTDVVEVQMNRDYRREYMRRLPAMLAAEREVRVWTPIRCDSGR